VFDKFLNFLLLWFGAIVASLVVIVLAFMFTQLANIAFDLGLSAENLRVFFVAFFYSIPVVGFPTLIWAFRK
jgi:hypothetical protein